MALSGVVSQHSAQDVDFYHSVDGHVKLPWKARKGVPQAYTGRSLLRGLSSIIRVALYMALMYLILSCISTLLGSQSLIDGHFSRRLAGITDSCQASSAAEVTNSGEADVRTASSQTHHVLGEQSGGAQTDAYSRPAWLDNTSLWDTRPFFREHTEGVLGFGGASQRAAGSGGMDFGRVSRLGRANDFRLEPQGPRRNEQVKHILGQSLIAAYELACRLDVRRGNSQARLRCVKRLLNAYSECLSALSRGNFLSVITDQAFKQFSLEWIAAIGARLQSWYSMMCTYDELLVPRLQRTQRHLYFIRQQLSGSVLTNASNAVLENNLRSSITTQAFVERLVKTALSNHNLREVALGARDLSDNTVRRYVASFGSGMTLHHFKAVQMPFVFLQCLDELYSTSNLMLKKRHSQLSFEYVVHVLEILNKELLNSTRYNIVFSTPPFRAGALYAANLFDQKMRGNCLSCTERTRDFFDTILNPVHDISPPTNALGKLVSESYIYLKNLRGLLRNARDILCEPYGHEALRENLRSIIVLGGTRQWRIKSTFTKLKLPLWPQDPDAVSQSQWMRMHVRYLRSQLLACRFFEGENETPLRTYPFSKTEHHASGRSFNALEDSSEESQLRDVAGVHRTLDDPTPCTCVKFAPLVLPINHMPARWTRWRLNMHSQVLEQQLRMTGRGGGPQTMEQRCLWTQTELQRLLMPEAEGTDMGALHAPQTVRPCEICGGLTVLRTIVTNPNRTDGRSIDGTAPRVEGAALLDTGQEKQEETDSLTRVAAHSRQHAACGDSCLESGATSGTLQAPPRCPQGGQGSECLEFVPPRVQMWSAVFSEWHAEKKTEEGEQTVE